MNSAYNFKDVFRYLMIIVGLCVAMMATGGVGFLVVIPFALSALFTRKAEQLTWWLLLSNATLAMNGYFAPKGFVYGVSHRALLGIVGIYGALLFLSTNPTKYITPLMGVFAYIVYMTIPSASGWAPLISYLKLLLFCLVYMALAFSSNNAIRDNHVDMRNLRTMMLAFAIFFVFGSVLIMPFPAISNMSSLEVLQSGGNVLSLYKGMCNHSQSLGIVVAFWTIFLFFDLIFHIQRFDKLYIVLMVTACLLLYKSSGRTAMGTMIVCLGFSYLFFTKYRGKIRSGWKVKLASVVTVFVILSGLAVIVIPQIRDGIVRFAMKYDTDAQTGDFDMEFAISTRQGLIDEQIYNFKKRPVIGWGFQVSEQVAEMSKGSVGLILTAPVEKGVWITAILEEGGVCGEIIYVIYLVIALILLYARKAYMGLTIFLALHISNLGEMTMFSVSGVGGMWYTFLFIALIFDAKRIQGTNIRLI